MTRINPTLAGKQLGTELRTLRRAANLSPRDAAAFLDCSHQKISHIEAARNNISRAELDVLCRHYGASAEKAAELEEMRVAAAQPRWWSTFGLPRWLSDYVGLEDAATRLRAVELELIPGLLQTPDYVRTLHAVAQRSILPDQIEQRVDARLERQKRLTAAEPLQLEVVMSESAVRRALAVPKVGPAQVRHLITVAALPNVEIHVLPVAAGLHASMSGSFALLEFETPPMVGWQEYAAGGHIVDDPNVVALLHNIWGELRAQALDTGESLRFLAELTGDTAHDESVGVAQG